MLLVHMLLVMLIPPCFNLDTRDICIAALLPKKCTTHSMGWQLVGVQKRTSNAIALFSCPRASGLTTGCPAAPAFMIACAAAANFCTTAGGGGWVFE
jgi:hypothetical protein